MYFNLNICTKNLNSDMYKFHKNVHHVNCSIKVWEIRYKQKYLFQGNKWYSLSQVVRNEPVHEKSNNFGSNQVWHKPGCTVTEDA